MPEIKKEVKTFEVNYIHDKCGEPMMPTGQVLMSNPPQFPHICRCGHTATFPFTYPRTVYEKV